MVIAEFAWVQFGVGSLPHFVEPRRVDALPIAKLCLVLNKGAMVRLLNGVSFEPGMYRFSSSCFPMQEAKAL